ncbi:TnsD family Tn7-like transposition protein [Deferribacteres bacterium DY0037]
MTRGGTIQHDFSCGLDNFFQHYKNYFKDVNQIIQTMTLLPYYRPFLDVWVYHRCVEAMRLGTINSLKMEMGLAASRLGADHPLKFCNDCIDEDIERFGTAYWHRLHQCPGIVICHKHKKSLFVARDKVNNIKRFEYFLPDKELNSEKLVNDIDIVGLVMDLDVINIFTEGLLNYPTFFLSPDETVKTYKKQLQLLGFVTSTGNIRQKLLLSDLSRHFNGFDKLPYYKELFFNNKNIFSSMLRKTKSSKHPLKHILLISYLYNSFNGFMSKYQSESSFSEQVSYNSNMQRKEELRMHLFEGMSLRKISVIMDISVTTLAIWAREMGHEIKARPKSITKELRQKVEQTLLSSFSMSFCSSIDPSDLQVN